MEISTILIIILKVIGYFGYFLCMYKLMSKRNGLRLGIYITVFVCLVVLSMRI